MGVPLLQRLQTNGALELIVLVLLPAIVVLSMILYKSQRTGNFSIKGFYANKKKSPFTFFAYQFLLLIAVVLIIAWIYLIFKNPG